MPFRSANQEMYMKVNKTKLWKEWVKKYGHHPKFKTLEKLSAKKAVKKGKRKKRK